MNGRIGQSFQGSSGDSYLLHHTYLNRITNQTTELYEVASENCSGGRGGGTRWRTYCTHHRRENTFARLGDALAAVEADAACPVCRHISGKRRYLRLPQRRGIADRWRAGKGDQAVQSFSSTTARRFKQNCAVVREMVEQPIWMLLIFIFIGGWGILGIDAAVRKDRTGKHPNYTARSQADAPTRGEPGIAASDRSAVSPTVAPSLLSPPPPPPARLSPPASLPSSPLSSSTEMPAPSSSSPYELPSAAAARLRQFPEPTAEQLAALIRHGELIRAPQQQQQALAQSRLGERSGPVERRVAPAEVVPSPASAQSDDILYTKEDTGEAAIPVRENIAKPNSIKSARVLAFIPTSLQWIIQPDSSAEAVTAPVATSAGKNGIGKNRVSTRSAGKNSNASEYPMLAVHDSGDGGRGGGNSGKLGVVLVQLGRNTLLGRYDTTQGTFTSAHPPRLTTIDGAVDDTARYVAEKLVKLSPAEWRQMLSKMSR